ncbi:MAG: hypothetical protein ACK5JS_05095 [Mangrovibacterium sp.]
MKQNLKFFAFLIASCLVLASCSSSDDGGDDGGNKDTVNTGTLTIGNTKKTLTSGYLEDYGNIADGVYDIDFTAISDASSTASPNEAVVYFDLYTTTDGVLAEGNYSLGSYETASSGTANIYGNYSDAAIGDNIETSASNKNNTYNIQNGTIITPTEGTFSVTESGDTYKVSFKGKGTLISYTDGEAGEATTEQYFAFTYEGSVTTYEGEYVTTALKSSAPNKLRRSFFN